MQHIFISVQHSNAKYLPEGPTHGYQEYKHLIVYTALSVSQQKYVRSCFLSVIDPVKMDFQFSLSEKKNVEGYMNSKWRGDVYMHATGRSVDHFCILARERFTMTNTCLTKNIS